MAKTRQNTQATKRVTGQRFTSRKEKREGQINEFHWIIGLITSESAEARRDR